MGYERTFVGLDVHARSVVGCAMDTVTGELVQRRLGTDPGEIRHWIGELEGPVAVTYEAGPTGFGLAQDPRAHGIACLVAAPSFFCSSLLYGVSAQGVPVPNPMTDQTPLPRSSTPPRPLRPFGRCDACRNAPGSRRSAAGCMPHSSRHSRTRAAQSQIRAWRSTTPIRPGGRILCLPDLGTRCARHGALQLLERPFYGVAGELSAGMCVAAQLGKSVLGVVLTRCASAIASAPPGPR